MTWNWKVAGLNLCVGLHLPPSPHHPHSPPPPPPPQWTQCLVLDEMKNEGPVWYKCAKVEQSTAVRKHCPGRILLKFNQQERIIGVGLCNSAAEILFLEKEIQLFWQQEKLPSDSENKVHVTYVYGIQKYTAKTC